MKVETLIFAYLAICGAMIVFNIVCIFVFRRRDKKLKIRSAHFTEEIEKQIAVIDQGWIVDAQHCAMLRKKLTKVNHLMAFDETLEGMYQTRPDAVKQYLRGISSVFVFLTLEYRKKNTLKVAYFPYIIKKYQVFRGYDISIVADMMVELVREPSLPCRENALHALYSMGNGDSVIKALRIIDESEYYHNSKLLTDGLLTFQGNKERLAQLLWQFYEVCSVSMKVTILNFFRFYSGDYCEKILAIMTEPNLNPEICYSCIRYFGKYHYEKAYPFLMEYAQYDREDLWEYAAIAVFALANYPGVQTIDLLKDCVRSRYWYVRYNASLSLQQLGMEYDELIDIFEGTDRYASEILRYRLDQRLMEKKSQEVRT